MHILSLKTREQYNCSEDYHSSYNIIIYDQLEKFKDTEKISSSVLSMYKWFQQEMISQAIIYYFAPINGSQLMDYLKFRVQLTIK
ncbi:hypothetical protein BpHYR1_037804 [Brachionus plicatilis]|uniref:Uncharacterized protein n=1 Tax=Brachionus plicatilis TaxID=10195 RepID=A0A3M7PUH2_BRAPC|nr:hypothetical protein BpHYR1_037804 [Brachionus plicatilis]